jgi:hypothetical protein
MSEKDQTLHFDHVPRTSGPPRTTDIAGPTRLVRSVPDSDVSASFDHLAGDGE